MIEINGRRTGKSVMMQQYYEAALDAGQRVLLVLQDKKMLVHRKGHLTCYELIKGYPYEPPED